MNLIDVDTKAFRTMKPPVHFPRPVLPRKRTRFEMWAWSPIVSFQVGLTAGYLALIFFGVMSFIAAPPAFVLTSPPGWNQVWAMALVLGAIVAAVGSVSRDKVFERLETLGASLVTLTVGSYACIMLWVAYATGYVNNVGAGAALVALVVPTLIRTMWLYSQLLRK